MTSEREAGARILWLVVIVAAALGVVFGILVFNALT